MQNAPIQAFSITEWCNGLGICINTFYRLPPEDRPATIKLGRRVLISRKAHDEWIARMEAKEGSTRG